MTPILVVFITYARSEYACRTIEAARSHLLYDGSHQDLHWYVSDDGSEKPHREAVKAALNGFKTVGGHTERISYGAGCNRALKFAKDNGYELMFFLEDDWELAQDMDLKPHADLLLTDPTVGMVRLGYLNAGMVGRCFPAFGHLYWRLNRLPATDADIELVFTGHPSLRHARFHQAYGKYAERLRPGDTEVEFAYRFRIGNGPDIVFPAGLGEWGVFTHIGKVKSY